ncbi:uncharacterized protein LOC120008061 [Tripterygium wilfordii]|uniref:uncharacterized protein LOC120008061 n=1 Tax=Tripterygium wilfordii TaxID=458696 RepID=UPI0018F80E23|nr:uncharacterized protein LOC120008061 [Tripterygium wilfordii]
MYTELKVSCAIDFIAQTNFSRNYNLSYMDIHKKLAYGMELSWSTISCAACRGRRGFCRLENNTIIQCCEDFYCNTTFTPPKCDLRCMFKYYFYDRVTEAIYDNRLLLEHKVLGKFLFFKFLLACTVIT